MDPAERPWLSRAFTALSDPLARDVLEAIRSEPGVTVSGLCDAFPVSRFTIMRELNALEDADLVRRERDGRTKQLFVEGRSFARLADGWLRRMADDEPAPKNPKEA
jgi:DNA-binding transcriptional ArsR family regulator